MAILTSNMYDLIYYLTGIEHEFLANNSFDVWFLNLNAAMVLLFFCVLRYIAVQIRNYRIKRNEEKEKLKEMIDEIKFNGVKK